MPKFCQNCGAMVEDSASFCNNCGSPMTAGYPEDPVTVNAQSNPAPNPYTYQPTQQPAYPAQQPAYPQQYPQQQYPAPAPAPRKKGKKVAVIIIVSVLALLLIAATVLIVVLPLVANIDVFGLKLFGGAKASTPEECMNSFIEALADDNTDNMLDCIYETKYSELMRSIFKSQLSTGSGMGEGLDEIRALGKDNVKKMVVITVTDEQTLSDTEVAKVKQTLAAATIPTDKIEKVEKANVHVQNNVKNENTDTEFCFAYAEGKWYILASAMSGGF